MQNNLTRLNESEYSEWNEDSERAIASEDWDDIDNIQRQTPKPKQRKPRERVPVSVQKVITEVDEYIEGGNFLTEKKFRNLAQETKGMEKISHIQASLNEMAFWQSLCIPISR